ncbi:cytokine receptor-like factor 2 isoform X1 [Saccopteryx bilineata]|uniref:cytokine receptor-like factor 2 isoform X1 n=1 Tax=Saccopteryx bilineata TaxID=59482 RepID=UPI00338D9B05
MGARGPPATATAAALLLLLGRLLAAAVATEDSGEAEEAGTGEELQFQIINFDYKTVRVTWNASELTGANLTFLYGFQEKELRPCSRYLLRGGRTAGCLLDAESDTIMKFSVWNGTRSLLSRAVWISYYLKPRSPTDLKFRWHPEAVTVTCSDLPYRNLLYEIQYKSSFDTGWQSQGLEKTCNVTILGLDVDRCYSFRARVSTVEDVYGPESYPSDWTEVDHQQGGEHTDSCREKTVFSKFILIYGMVATLTVFLLFLSLWKLRRIKKLLMPSVPDPKFSFPGLFESHHGNFQEWIKDTQHVTHLTKADEGEPDCVLAEALVVEEPPEIEVPASPTMVTMTTAAPGKDPVGEPSQQPHQHPSGEEVVSVGGFTFVISDNAYVTL